jgi:hypothetical protein
LALFAGLAEFVLVFVVAEFVFVLVLEFVVAEFVLVEFILPVGVGVKASVLGVALVKGKFGLTPLVLDLFVLVLVLVVPLQAKPNAPIPTSNEIVMIFLISDFSCFLLFKLKFE